METEANNMILFDFLSFIEYFFKIWVGLYAPPIKELLITNRINSFFNLHLETRIGAMQTLQEKPLHILAFLGAKQNRSRYSKMAIPLLLWVPTRRFPFVLA